MLTIQPGLSKSYNRIQPFGGRSDFQSQAQDVDFEESFDYYDIDREKEDAKKELDLWKQTKNSVDSLAKQADMVPGVKTGTKILSGLTAVAIGWGGLRWGTVGTLEVLSKLGETSLVKSIGGKLNDSRKFVAKKASDFGKYVSERNWYKNTGAKMGEWKSSFLQTTVGAKLNSLSNAVKDSSAFHKTIDAKSSVVKYFKDLNYKRVFVETMGVAGGGTAAVNLLGGKTIDGNKQNVEKNIDGKYFVDGREMRFDEGDRYDAA